MVILFVDVCFRGSKKNLLEIFELMQVALNDDNEVQLIRTLEPGIQGKTNKVLKCIAAVNLGSVSAFSAGAGSKESDAVASTSDFSSKGKGDEDSGCVPTASTLFSSVETPIEV